MALGLLTLVVGLVIFPPIIRRVVRDRDHDPGSFALGWGVSLLWFTGSVARFAALRISVVCLVLAAVGMIVLTTRLRSGT